VAQVKVRLVLEFFLEEIENPSGFPVITIDSEDLERNGSGIVYQCLTNYLKHDNDAVLYVSSAAPIGDIALISRAVQEITGKLPIWEVSAAGLIPAACVQLYSFLT
jgi:hypothetical protein